MNCNRFTPVFNRRDLLRTSANGFGFMALAALLGEEAGAAAKPPIGAPTSVGHPQSHSGPLSLRAPHFTPRAKLAVNFEKRWLGAPNANADAQRIVDTIADRFLVQATIAF